MQNDRLIDGSLRPFVRFMEHLYIQNNAMKKLLETVPGLNWRTEVAKLMAAEDRSNDNRLREIEEALGPHSYWHFNRPSGWLPVTPADSQSNLKIPPFSIDPPPFPHIKFLNCANGGRATALGFVES